jgi:hypothetical protein
MSVLALVLSASLAQAAAMPCTGERVVLVPFAPVALSQAETRGLEDAVRRAVGSTAGVCLEPRAETVARLRALGPAAASCEGAVCLGGKGGASGPAWLLRGVALGVGGARSVLLTLGDSRGWEWRGSFQLPGADAAPGEAEQRARQAFGALWRVRPSAAGGDEDTVSKPAPLWPKVLLAAGGAALAAGVGFGVAARNTESRVSKAGDTGCTGEGAAFRDCLDGKLKSGRRQATVSNVLLGSGALLGAGGAVFLIWELP